MNQEILINGVTRLKLTQNDYKAQGGQGIVYVKGGYAYKIYHDPIRMIPSGKINELKALNSIPIVLSPVDILYCSKTNKEIGFSMKYVSDCEYFTKLFSKQFKSNNSISHQTIVDLTTVMQNTLRDIHKNKILVGDYNEMNFLTDKSYMIPYHIDVDSYQTPNYPCTAIMNTVRDRRLPFGSFDELSDWFSWAVVTFQMYTGIHPYMGRHPKYKTTELDERMVNRISVFDRDVKIPKGCQDFSVIPKNQLEWYKKVFVDGHRSEPPLPGDFLVLGFTPVLVSGDNFVVDLIHNYNEKIISVQYMNGVRYVVTERAIYKTASEIFTFTHSKHNVKLIEMVGMEPILIVSVGNSLQFYDIQKNKIGEIASDGWMISDKKLYTVVSGNLLENSFTSLAKILHSTSRVDNIAPNFNVYDGMVVQDIFGKARLSIPMGNGICYSLNIHELNGCRIIEGKRIKRFAQFLLEKNGTYSRMVIHFSSDFSSYTFKQENDITYKSFQMIVKDNGMMVSIIEDDTMELMMDTVRGEKRVGDSPIESDMLLIDAGERVMFASGRKLYSVKSK